MEEKKTLFGKFKEKIQKTKEKAAERRAKMFHYFATHPEVTMSVFSALATVGIGTGMAVTKAARRQYEACRVEDDITGESVTLAHPLTNEEVVELNRRMSEGESKLDILRDMGLLR